MSKPSKTLRLNYYPLSLVFPALLVFSIFTILPVLMGLTYSFTDWHIMRMDKPEFRGILNYTRIFQDSIFIRSLLNTLFFAFSTTVIKTFVGLCLALLLVKKISGSNLFRTLFYLPCVLSATVIGVLFKAILSEEGLLNHSLELVGLDILTQDWLSSYDSAMASIIYIESWMWSGFNMMIFIAGLQAIPNDYFEVAHLEGASNFKKLFYITIPLLVPAFTVVITLNMSGSLRVFELIYVLTNGGPGFDTQVMNTYAFRSFSQGLLGESSAASIILALIVVSISFTINKYLKSKEIEL